MIIQNIIYVEISLSGRSVREEELVSVYRSHHIIRPHGLREVKPCGFESEDLPSLEGWRVGLLPVTLDTWQGGQVTRETVHG